MGRVIITEEELDKFIFQFGHSKEGNIEKLLCVLNVESRYISLLYLFADEIEKKTIKLSELLR